MSERKEQTIDYDIEWIQLIAEAKNLGIEIDEIRNFLQGQVHS